MKRILPFVVFTLASSLNYAQFWKVGDPHKLAGTVNTELAEESIPVFDGENTMYFVRTYDDKNSGGSMDQDIWKSAKQSDGSYTDCERVSGMNNKFFNAVLAVRGNGQRMYLLNAYEGKKDKIKGLAVAQKTSKGWSAPEALNIPGLDIDGDYYGFFVSEDEKVIVISYNGPGSAGEEDLYVSVKNGDNWSAPQHMGNSVNTTGYEIAPFLSKDNDTLFFSSNGLGGLGDADVFYSVKQNGWSTWSKPVNLGRPVNSDKFDAYFSYQGDKIYWSSNRGQELSDIYVAEILKPSAPLSLAIKGTNCSVNKGMDGKADLTVIGGVAPFKYQWDNGEKIEDLVGVPTGKYAVKVTDAIGQEAEIDVFIGEPGIVSKEFNNLTFNHYFAYNKAILSTTEGDLKKFVSEIKDQLRNGRESIIIEINASASNVPTKTYSTNDKLVQARASNMKRDLENYFAENNLSNRVKVQIVSAVVQGPPYTGDAADEEIYAPFQYIQLRTK